jgi:hypothetical protein
MTLIPYSSCIKVCNYTAYVSNWNKVKIEKLVLEVLRGTHKISVVFYRNIQHYY